MFSPLFNSTNQQLFKKNCLKRIFVTKEATTDDFRNKWKPSRAINTFCGEQEEGCGKSMKNALHVQRYGKRHLSGWSDVE